MTELCSLLLQLLVLANQFLFWAKWRSITTGLAFPTPVRIILGSSTGPCLAIGSGHWQADSLIIPTIRNFFCIFNLPWQSGGLSLRGLLIGYVIDRSVGAFYFKNWGEWMPSKLAQLSDARDLVCTQPGLDSDFCNHSDPRYLGGKTGRGGKQVGNLLYWLHIFSKELLRSELPGIAFNSIAERKIYQSLNVCISSRICRLRSYHCTQLPHPMMPLGSGLCGMNRLRGWSSCDWN